MGNFKYDIELGLINKYSPCPCIEAVSVDMPAYRYGYEDLFDERNFLPQSVKDKREGRKRRLSTSANDNCDYYGLSMFVDEKSANHFWTEVIDERTRNLLGYKTLMHGNILKPDGVVTPPKRGHFNLHEFENTDLTNRFTILYII